MVAPVITGILTKHFDLKQLAETGNKKQTKQKQAHQSARKAFLQICK